MDAKMIIVSPGKPSSEVLVPVTQWDEFVNFMEECAEELRLPRGVTKVFLLCNGEDPETIKDAWMKR